MDNPFDQINSELKEIKKLLKERPETQPMTKNGVDLLRFIPIKDLFRNKICSRPTFYAHLKNREFTLYKFGNLSYVDRQDFEKAFRPVVLRKVA